jgi:hypothetical protein
MQKKKRNNDNEIKDSGPKAREFVLVRDQRGNFKYYYKGKFYTEEEVSKILSPKEIEKLKEKEKVEQKKEEKEPEKIKETPPELKDLERKFFERYTDKIIKESGVELTGIDKNKLIKAIISRLRGVRRDTELKYILTASISAGGVGLAEPKAEKIISKIKEYLTEVENKRLELIREKQMPEELKPPPVPPAVPEAPAKQPKIARKTLSGLDEKKPVISDIKPVSALVGPVQELATMDLVNLRRLGANKEEIISEITERINLLAEQSVQKKIQGIEAWKSSPVYQRYLDLGYLSIKENKPVEQIISEKAGKDEKTLTFEEFQAIMELNSKLQF